jgi:protein O-GlcNAc transferase
MGRELSVLLPAHAQQDVLVFCYAQNPPHDVHDGPYRRKFVQGVHAFREINPLSDLAVAQMMRDDKLDILVDLMGYTHGARDGVVAHRPARLQISFKGYMSTMGSAYHDGLVADLVSVPAEMAPYYSEALLHVAPVFSASTHAINHPDVPYLAAVSRKDAKLPQDPEVFVFACFNSLYKITPSLFNVWLSILKKVPKSVLWLLKEPADAAAYLCRAAKAKGVSCSRLIFTPKVPITHHLQIKANAGLFLDTVLYNAHSTAADALWAGIPVLTLAREKMASRVGASLALSLGLPQLVARTLAEYEEIAVRLATSPGKLARLRRQLVVRRTLAMNAAAGGSSTAGRAGAPGLVGGGGGGGASSCRDSSTILFDVPRWMRCYERLLGMALEARGASTGPADGTVRPVDARGVMNGERAYHLIVV